MEKFKGFRAALFASAIAICTLCSCKKDKGAGGQPSQPEQQKPALNAPTVAIGDTVNNVLSDVPLTYASSHDTIRTGGNVLSDGGAPVTARGVCWGTAQNPSIADSRTSNATGTGRFASTVGGLKVGTKYFLRAYATNSVGTAYSRQVAVTPYYKVGESFQGGIVFYVDDTKLHGLIAATADQGRAIAWAPASLFTKATGATSQTDGAGNTSKIVSAYGGGSYGAKLCRDYRGGGYSDWYLPSLWEAVWMQGAQGQVGGFEQPTASSTLIEYWTSTEGSNFQAVSIDFRYGNTYSGSEKRVAFDVRAIRKF